MNPVPDALTLSGAEHGLSLLRLVGALGVVLIAFWVFARVMRQLNGSASGSSAGLKIIGSLSLGQRERLVVLDAGDERIVLGVTANTITRVHAMPALPAGQGDAAVGALSGIGAASRTEPPMTMGVAFAERMRAALQRSPT